MPAGGAGPAEAEAVYDEASDGGEQDVLHGGKQELQAPAPGRGGVLQRAAVDHCDPHAEEGTKDGRRPLSLYSILSLLGMARKALETASSWSKAQGTLARVLRASSRGEKAQIKEEPGQREREAAKKLLLLASSESAQKALEAGTLLSLGAQYKGGMVVVSGRAKKATLARLLGLEELVVVMPQEQLAKIVMQDAHRKDHRRTPQDVIARARRHVWIPKGTQLARKVVRECHWCRRENVKMQKQLMAAQG